MRSKTIGVLSALLVIFALCACSRSQVMDKGGTVRDPAVPSEASTDGKELSYEEPVVLQSGPCVEYDNGLLFRVLGLPLEESSALGAAYSLRKPSALQGNFLYLYTPEGETKAPKILCEDPGYGDLYLLGDMLYSQRMTDDEEAFVYLRNLTDNEVTEIGRGEILGFSDNLRYFTARYTDPTDYQIYYYIYDTEDLSGAVTKIRPMGGTDDLIFLGMDDSHPIFLEDTGDPHTFNVKHYDLDGSSVILCSFTTEGAYAPVYEGDFSYDPADDSVNFVMNEYEGSAFYYCKSQRIKVFLANEKADNKDRKENYSMEEFVLERDPSVKDYSGVLLYTKNYSDEGEAFISTVYEYKETADGTYYVLADSVRDPFRDIGWRYSYTLLNLRYFYLPDNSDDPVLLKRLYAPGGSRETLMELKKPEEETPTITAFVSFVGVPGEMPKTALYRMIEVTGVETPITCSNTYKADLSDDLLYESMGSDLDRWSVLEGNAIAVALSDMPEYFRDTLPEPPVAESYELDRELDFDNAFCAHIGFDDEGRIDYIRPVIFD